MNYLAARHSWGLIECGGLEGHTLETVVPVLCYRHTSQACGKIYCVHYSQDLWRKGFSAAIWNKFETRYVMSSSFRASSAYTLLGLNEDDMFNSGTKGYYKSIMVYFYYQMMMLARWLQCKTCCTRSLNYKLSYFC